jgi:hypothetical protein
MSASICFGLIVVMHLCVRFLEGWTLVRPLVASAPAMTASPPPPSQARNLVLGRLGTMEGRLWVRARNLVQESLGKEGETQAAVPPMLRIRFFIP